MQGGHGSGRKLVSEKRITIARGYDMIFMNGKISDSVNYKMAIRLMDKRITRTLSGEKLDPERVINAAGRMAEDAMSGKFDREFARYLQPGGSQPGKEPLSFHDGLSAAMAELFRADSLRKKFQLELSGFPDSSAEGKRFRRLPIGVLLHIAAGNAEGLPAYSVLEGLLAGNINILKLPAGDDGLSLFILKKLTEYEPVLKEYIYVMDTPSGDEKTMKMMMRLAGGIAVWGSDETILAVRRSAPANVKLIEWGHRLSFAYIDDLDAPEEKLGALARHIFSTKQLLCSSCQVIYLNTVDFEDVKKFGRRFAKIMKREEGTEGNSPFIQGKVTVELMTRRLERVSRKGCRASEKTQVNRASGKMQASRASGKAQVNRASGKTQACRKMEQAPSCCVYRAGSGSVICMDDNKLEVSGQFGNVLVKPLPREQIITALYSSKRHLQTVGMYPESRELGRLFEQCGLTSLCGLENMSEFEITGSHDGTFALREYTRIAEYKNKITETGLDASAKGQSAKG